MTTPITTTKTVLKDEPSTPSAIVSSFFTVLFVGSVAGITAFLISRGVAYATSEGNFIPLLGVLGTASVAFVGWRIVKRAAKDTNLNEA